MSLVFWQANITARRLSDLTVLITFIISLIFSSVVNIFNKSPVKKRFSIPFNALSLSVSKTIVSLIVFSFFLRYSSDCSVYKGSFFAVFWFDVCRSESNTLKNSCSLATNKTFTPSCSTKLLTYPRNSIIFTPDLSISSKIINLFLRLIKS